MNWKIRKNLWEFLWEFSDNKHKLFLDELFYILRKIKYLFIWQNRDNVNNNIYK